MNADYKMKGVMMLGCCSQQPNDNENKPSKTAWIISLLVLGTIFYSPNLL